MIEMALPLPLMLALRWILLLGPLLLVVVMVRMRKLSKSRQIGGLFAFLYGVAIVFISHSIALYFNWWTYGWSALMLNGLPADIIIGGAVLFGPGLYFAFPRTRPLMICLPIIIGLHGTIFNSLEPLVFAGPNWFIGVGFVFITAHIPAIYLAKWTEADTHLPLRCALLASMTGGMIFAIVPSLIMQAMGGSWDLLERPVWSLVLVGVLLTFTSLVGVSANHTLCIQGKGTPIPLDPTKRLVTTGIYAYVSNPMQLSAALSWLVLGAFLQNIWIAAAALMAWVFVQGMVRWHHRHDLLKRFPDGWPEYKTQVPEWIPRWRPWTKASATLQLDPKHRLLRLFLSGATGLNIRDRNGASQYSNPADVCDYRGASACLMSLTHVNFAWTMAAYAALVPLLAFEYGLRQQPFKSGQKA